MKSSAQLRAGNAPARIHLRVQHPKLDPQEITRILAMVPEHTLHADRHASSTPADCYWIAPFTFSEFDESWRPSDDEQDDTTRRAASTLQPLADETVIGLALRRLQAHRSFFTSLVQEGGSATLLLNVNKARSMSIPPSLARKLAQFEIGLELDWSDSSE
ncbi:MAG TPA: hypothetical protein VIL28_13950 [Steroidobacteraceae bacterium]